jgi:hypothetical protein
MVTKLKIGLIRYFGRYILVFLSKRFSNLLKYICKRKVSTTKRFGLETKGVAYFTSHTGTLHISAPN